MAGLIFQCLFAVIQCLPIFLQSSIASVSIWTYTHTPLMVSLQYECSVQPGMQNSYTISVISSNLKKVRSDPAVYWIILVVAATRSKQDQCLSLHLNCGYYNSIFSCWCQNRNQPYNGLYKNWATQLINTNKTKCGFKGIWAGLHFHIPSILGSENCLSHVHCHEARIWLSIRSNLSVWMMMLMITASGSTCLISKKLSRHSINCISMWLTETGREHAFFFHCFLCTNK